MLDAQCQRDLQQVLTGLSSHFPAEGGGKKKGTKKKGSSFQTVSVLFRVSVFSGRVFHTYDSHIFILRQEASFSVATIYFADAYTGL